MAASSSRLALLDGVALGEGSVRFAVRVGERVAHLLQLPEPEQPRRAPGIDPMRHGDAAESLGEDPAELELEPADLPATRAGKTLVNLERLSSDSLA